MRKERLIERIRQWQLNTDNNSLPPDESKQVLIESIRNHIEQLLTTRQGNTLIDRYYGFDDESQLMENFSISNEKQFKQDLSRSLLKYEPRLAKLEVTQVDKQAHKQRIVCHINAQLSKPFDEVTFYFTTILTEQGRAIVEL